MAKSQSIPVMGPVMRACPRPLRRHDFPMNVPLGRVAKEIVERLGLKPHPEGGYYAETFRSPLRVKLSDGRERSAGTAIYFLLGKGEFSALHRVASDETWHHYAGAPLEVLLIQPDGRSEILRLGTDLATGERPQIIVPAGVWQAARSCGEYTLVGCTVSPGFEFGDFEMPSRAELLTLFPQYRDLVIRFTRE